MKNASEMPSHYIGRAVSPGSALSNPLYHLTQFGLANPMVQWAIGHGAYDEYCHACDARGFLATRPCLCVEAEGGCPTTRTRCSRERACEHCRRRCGECGGSGLQADRPVCDQDILDEESRRVARRLGVRIDPRRQLR